MQPVKVAALNDVSLTSTIVKMRSDISIGKHQLHSKTNFVFIIYSVEFIYINFGWTKTNWLEQDLNLRPLQVAVSNPTLVNFSFFIQNWSKNVISQFPLWFITWICIQLAINILPNIINQGIRNIFLNPNSLDNKGSWRTLKDCYCSATMLWELGLINVSRDFVCFS